MSKSFWGIEHGEEVAKGDNFKAHVWNKDLGGRSKQAQTNRKITQKEIDNRMTKGSLAGAGAGLAAGVAIKYGHGAAIGAKTAAVSGKGFKALGKTSKTTSFKDAARKGAKIAAHANAVGRQSLRNGNNLGAGVLSVGGGFAGQHTAEIKGRKAAMKHPKYKAR